MVRNEILTTFEPTVINMGDGQVCRIWDGVLDWIQAAFNWKTWFNLLEAADPG